MKTVKQNIILHQISKFFLACLLIACLAYTFTPLANASSQPTEATDIQNLAIFDTDGTPPVQAASDTPAQLTIEQDSNSRPGNTIEIPVTLATNGNQIAATGFALNFDQEQFSFDTTDSDDDGIPDVVNLHVDSRLISYVNYNREESRVEVVLYSLGQTAAFLEDGVMATIALQVNDHAATGKSTISFSHSSAGTANGQDILVESSNGTVSIDNETRFNIFLPLVTK